MAHKGLYIDKIIICKVEIHISLKRFELTHDIINQGPIHCLSSSAIVGDLSLWRPNASSWW